MCDSTSHSVLNLSELTPFFLRRHQNFIQQWLLRHSKKFFYAALF